MRFPVAVFVVLLCAFACGWPYAARADAPPVEVVVGGYQFEPFVDDVDGVAKRFLDLLNSAQHAYKFRFLDIPARRRYELMAEGKIDMLLFEMPVWGWQAQMEGIETTPPVLTGAEVFIARTDAPEGAAIFNDIPAHKIALTLGYHYGFADFNSDPDYLKAHFNVVFAEFQRHTLRHVLAGTSELAIVNEAMLERAFMKHPELRAQIMVAERPDQTYELPVMVRRKGPISADQMTAILSALARSGKLQAFFDKEGLGRFVTFKD